MGYRPAIYFFISGAHPHQKAIMSEETIEVQASPTPDDATNVEEVNVSEELEAVAQDANSREMTPQERAQLFKRLKAIEQAVKQTPSQTNTQKPVEQPAATPAPASGEYSPEEYTDLRIEGYSHDEIEQVKRYARANNLSLRDAVKEPFVQAGINALRGDEKVEQATPPPSSSPSVVPKKSVGEYRSDMTKAEKEAWFAAKKKKG